MTTKRFISIIYFIVLSYVVFGIRVYPKMLKIRRGYNLRVFNDGILTRFHSNNNVFVHADFYGNILLFIPFAFCMKQIVHVQKSSHIFFIGLGVSVLIELTQYIFRVGFADINDVLTNAAGLANVYFLAE